MFYMISWFLVLALLATWSICIWVLHSLAAWSMTGAGALIDSSQQMDRFTLPGWIAFWLPPDLMLAVKASAATVLPWVESALSALPSALPWLGPLTWTVWGAGCLILGLGGVLLHTLIAMMHATARR